MAAPLRAFRSKSFRIFYAGQGFSLLGTWMQTVAMSWLVYRLTGLHPGAQQGETLFLQENPCFSRNQPGDAS